MLLVDTREAPERLRPLIAAGFAPKALAAGDVNFPAAGGLSVLVENKKVAQLVTDLASGQLRSQCRRLIDAADFPVLCIEGRWTQVDGYVLGQQPWTWDQVWNYLQGLQDIGIRLQLSTDPEHTVQRIISLADWYEKPEHSSHARSPSGDHRITVLLGIRGVGSVTAQAIVEALPSIAAIATASPDTLMGIDGIGIKTAQAIHKYFNSTV